MTKRIVLAGLLALAAVPALGASATSASKAPISTDEARAQAGQQIAAQQKANSVRACSCSHGH